MSARTQQGSLQRRTRAGVWKWMGLWYEGGSRKAKTLGLCSTMTKAQAATEFVKYVQPVNEARGTVEYSLQGYVRQVVFP
jgi:hypothetical protein